MQRLWLPSKILCRSRILWSITAVLALLVASSGNAAAFCCLPPDPWFLEKVTIGSVNAERYPHIVLWRKVNTTLNIAVVTGCSMDGDVW
jgi:hypothetical protein